MPMPSPVAKGHFFATLDELFGPPEEHFLPNLRTAIGLLEDGSRTLEDLAGALAGGEPMAVDGLPGYELPKGASLTPRDVPHFVEHVLGLSGDAEQVLRRGYLEALRHAERVRLPVSSAWVCSSDTGAMSVAFFESPTAVSVLLLTPPPADLGEEAGQHDDRAWLVTAENAGDPEIPPAPAPRPVQIDRWSFGAAATAP